MFGVYLIFGIIIVLFILKEIFFNMGEEKTNKTSTNSKFVKIIYQNPVVSAFLMNIVALLISRYSVKDNMSYIYFALMFVGIGNRKILDNGINLTRQKRLIILLSFFIVISGFSIYSTHIHNVKAREILKNLQ